MANDAHDLSEPSFPRKGRARPDGAGRPQKSLLRARFEEAKDSYIESSLGKQESWAKKVTTSFSGVLLDDIPVLLDALELRIVSKEKVCIDKDLYESLRTMAAVALSTQKKWDDDE